MILFALTTAFGFVLAFLSVLSVFVVSVVVVVVSVVVSVGVSVSFFLSISLSFSGFLTADGTSFGFASSFGSSFVSLTSPISSFLSFSVFGSTTFFLVDAAFSWSFCGSLGTAGSLAVLAGATATASGADSCFLSVILSFV